MTRLAARERLSWRSYLTNPHEFDGWVKANAVVGSILAIGMLAMAFAGLYFAGAPDAATASVAASK
jgi:hypothetical protein